MILKHQIGDSIIQHLDKNYIIKNRSKNISKQNIDYYHNQDRSLKLIEQSLSIEIRKAIFNLYFSHNPIYAKFFINN